MKCVESYCIDHLVAAACAQGQRHHDMLDSKSSLESNSLQFLYDIFRSLSPPQTINKILLHPFNPFNPLS